MACRHLIATHQALQVRALPLKAFQEEYAGDIDAALLALVTERLAASQTGAVEPQTAARGTRDAPQTTARATARRPRAPPPRFGDGPATATRRSDTETLPQELLNAALLLALETTLTLVSGHVWSDRGGATPAVHQTASGAPATIRAPRPGETLYSESGDSACGQWLTTISRTGVAINHSD